jgi:RNA polymerase sigma-70 factor (ECF subfamily)
MDADQGEQDERALKEAVLAGSEEAWRVLFDRAYASLTGFVHLRTRRDACLTEEVVQEAFLVAVRNMRRFDPDRASFESWMKGIALNTLRNLRRRRGAEGTESLPDVAREDSGQGGPDEVTDRVALALTALPRRYRDVLHAKYKDGLAVAEIALRFGETEKAIESLLTRAREAFKRAFGTAES